MPRGMPYFGSTFAVGPANAVRAWREEKRRENPKARFMSDRLKSKTKTKKKKTP